MNRISTAFLCLYFLSIFALGYLVQQSTTFLILAAFGVAFLVYFYLIRTSDSSIDRWGTPVAFAARALLIFSIPALSDDIYRFIWDGLLMVNGVNPFLFTPEEVIIGQEFLWANHELFSLLNSPGYYSVYPPLSQILFSIGPALWGDEVFATIVFLHLVMLAADMGTIHFMKQILRNLGKKSRLVYLYALNPLVIVELNGNLHFEGIMIFFLMLSFYFFQKKSGIASAFFIALSIATKAIPLIVSVVIAFRLKLAKMIGYITAMIVFLWILFAPVWIHWSEFLSSIDLYFRTFEFNASMYYVVRWFGYRAQGYNIIATSGPLLSMIGALLIVGIALFWNFRDRSRVFEAALLCLTVYLVFSTTVHPWYLATLVALSVFTAFRFAIWWSFLVVVSYVAYGSDPVRENLLLIFAEYFIILSIMVYELIKTKKAAPREQLLF